MILSQLIGPVREIYSQVLNETLATFKLNAVALLVVEANGFDFLKTI